MAENQTPEFPFPSRPNGAPPAEWAELRGCPVGHVKLPSGDQARLALRYEDVRHVMSNSVYSRVRGDGATMFGPGDVWDDGYSLPYMDPPEHTRLRSAVAKAFSARAVTRWQELTETVAGKLVDAMLEAGPPVDLMAAFAYPLPILVIAAMLGVPESEISSLKVWVDRYIGRELAVGGGDQQIEAALEVAGYVEQAIAERLENPGEGGLLDDALQRHRADGSIALGDVTVIGSILIFAGYETTATALGRGILQLLAHPEQLDMLRADPGLIPGAVEEILRHQSLSQIAMLRYATTDDTLPSGASVRKGEAVLAPLGAANLDPEWFDEPDRFDIRRSGASDHLAFGAGAHYCLGAALARLELRVGLEQLIGRLPGLAMAAPSEDVAWNDRALLSGPLEVPVTW